MFRFPNEYETWVGAEGEFHALNRNTLQEMSAATIRQGPNKSDPPVPMLGSNALCLPVWEFGDTTFEVNSLPFPAIEKNVELIVNEFFTLLPQYLAPFGVTPSASSMPLSMPPEGFLLSPNPRWSGLNKPIVEPIRKASTVTGFQPNIGTFENADEAVWTANAIGPWVHVLEAIGAGSPFSYNVIGDKFALHDTGVCSARASIWRASLLVDEIDNQSSWEQYELASRSRVIKTLPGIDNDNADISMDRSRIRVHQNRIEFRNIDSPLTKDMAKLELLLARALVDTMRMDLRSKDAHAIQTLGTDDRRRAAKIASMFGLSRMLWHPTYSSGACLRPAQEVVNAFFALIKEKLSPSETTFVRNGLNKIMECSQPESLRRQWQVAQQKDREAGTEITGPEGVAKQLGQAGCLYLTAHIQACQEIGGFDVKPTTVDRKTAQTYERAMNYLPQPFMNTENQAMNAR